MGNDIERAVELLKRGGVVAFPTETVYGLGANADDERAVARVFDIKGRPHAHPLIVHVASAADLERYVSSVSDEARQLADALWPGALTLVLARREGVATAAAGGHRTIAIRVPAHPIALELVQRFGGGIAAPSANRFGEVSPTTADHVRNDLGQEIDLVLDGGASSVGVESTIVDVTGAPTILRPGGVTRERLEEILGREVPVRESGGPSAPGTLESHYAPSARVVVVSEEDLEREVKSLRSKGARVAVIAGRAIPGALHVLDTSDAEQMARGLYAALRECDEKSCDVVVACLPSSEGLGLAVADRLQRAAADRG